MPLGRKREAKKRRLSTWALIVEDIRAWKRMGYLGPSDGSKLRVKDAINLIWQCPGLRATINYRASAGAKRRRIPALPGILTRRNLRRYGLDIVPSVPIGPGLYIPHPVGTVIMARAIGSNCQIISAVTVGMRGLQEFATIGDNVFIGAGARVLGAIHVGDGAQIGANAVIISDVPAGATAVGVPARILPPKRDEWPAERPSESGPALVAQYSQPYVADTLVAPTQNHSVRWDADLDATLRRPPDTGAARER
jgi:serine O-acetyltransferase